MRKRGAILVGVFACCAGIMLSQTMPSTFPAKEVRRYSVHSGSKGEVRILNGGAIQSSKVMPVMNVVPDGHELGPGWRRRISRLMDPASHPAEIVEEPDQVAEATLQEWRRAVRDTNCTISGWAQARYEFQSRQGTNRYDLSLERYRSEEAVEQEFSRLVVLNGHLQHGTVHDIGDTSVIERDKGDIILRFRRGLFRVSIASYGGTPAGEVAGSLRYLAKAVDERIAAELEPNKKE